MTKTNAFFYSVLMTLFIGCSVPKSTTPTTPPVQRIPAKFDFSPPFRVQSGSTGITIAIVRPVYVGKNAEYYISPYKEMSTSMGADFEELLTAKGFTIRGPFGSRDEMVYNDKINSSFIIEIVIELDPRYNQKYTSKTNWGSIMDKTQSATTQKMYGEMTLAGRLVINAKSSKYGELLWKKNIDLEPASFTYSGSMTWQGIPTISEELNKDNQVYNTLARELEKFYQNALNLAWQQIDPVEMKSVALQGKKADAKE